MGEDQAQQKLASQLVTQFSNKISNDLDSFVKETTLTIDISPFPPSLVFYQKECTRSLNQAKDLNYALPEVTKPKAPAPQMQNSPPVQAKPLSLEEFKTQCNNLGFKVGTQDFGNCVLELNDSK